MSYKINSDLEIGNSGIKLNDVITFDQTPRLVGKWFGQDLYRVSVSVEINSVGNQVVYTLPSRECRIKICNAWLYKTNSQYSNLVNWNDDIKGSDFGILYYDHNLGQLRLNVSDPGWLQLTIYYTIENN